MKDTRKHNEGVNITRSSKYKISLQSITIVLWCLSQSTSASALPNVPRPQINETELVLTEKEVVVKTTDLFLWQDYSVLATMLIVSCAIGVFYGYFGEKQTTGDDFLLGGSSMGTLPMALSLAASFITAIELLGNPAEMYMAGAQFWMICLAFLLVMPVTSHLYLPVFMRLRLTSCYEYLEVRFCKSMRVYACALYMMQMILYTAVAVYAPALALSDGGNGLYWVLDVAPYPGSPVEYYHHTFFCCEIALMSFKQFSLKRVTAGTQDTPGDHLSPQ